jgi:hypothetical protein
MTILDAVNKLLNFYNQKDIFTFEEDFQNTIFISEDPNLDKIVFILALEDLEKNDMVKSYKQGKKTFYVLKKPLISYDQNIVLSGVTATLISKVINDFCDKIKDKRDYCDPKSISEKDIRNLTFLASIADVKNNQKQENID